MKTIFMHIVALSLCAFASHAQESAYQLLKAGEVMPGGWIREQIRLDLEQGYYPRYDKVNHTVTHDLFIKQDRISSGMETPYHGLRCWWSGEHEGYWKDGVLRMAFLAGDEEQKSRALKWMDAIVAAQGKDGYLGIYKAGNETNTRFKHQAENGELWATSRILQALIAAYDFTGEKKYFTAVQRAVDCIIKNDPGNYFKTKGKSSGGVSHAVGFFDSLWFLIQRTGNEKYVRYAKELYRDFCSTPHRNDDLITKKLLSNKKFYTHGAHIAEGFYVPRFIATLSNTPELNRAADRALQKLKYHLTPSGAMVCDEHIRGRPGSGDTGYEYCGIAELIQAFPKLIGLTGKAEVAEITETMMFNAAQGSRFPILQALIYVNHDNIRDAKSKPEQDRHSYSPVHNAAACCALNGGRVTPYYVEGMWMRSKDGLVAPLFGPCTVATDVNGVKVSIQEETGYPFEDQIRFTVSPQTAVEFSIRLRHPARATAVRFDGVDAKRDGNFWVITRTWSKPTTFTMHLDFGITVLTETGKNRERYMRRGPLVYALPLAFKKKVVKEILPKLECNHYDIMTTDLTGWNYRMPDKPGFSVVRLEGDPLRPYAKPTLAIKGSLVTGKGDPAPVQLLPIGATTMRRTTFPMAGKRKSKRKK